MTGTSVGAMGMIALTIHAFGVRSVWFAFAIVWFPTAWLAVITQVFGLRLPRRLYALGRVERDGRLYERLGVRVAKRLLRRGPLHVFAPTLRIPPSPTPDSLRRLEDGMREAEAIHSMAFTVTLAAALWTLTLGWSDTAGWILLFTVIVNGYPTMLQRYNRALLINRFGGELFMGGTAAPEA